jgi:hypothetical protein
MKARSELLALNRSVQFNGHVEVVELLLSDQELFSAETYIKTLIKIRNKQR